MGGNVCKKRKESCKEPVSRIHKELVQYTTKNAISSSMGK